MLSGGELENFSGRVLRQEGGDDEVYEPLFSQAVEDHEVPGGGGGDWWVVGGWVGDWWVGG